MSTKVFLALGSNLGDRAGNIEQALSALRCGPDIHNLQTAPLYETSPLYMESEPAFYNTVVSLRTGLSPQELWQRLRNIELALGRPFPRPKNVSRIIDIDILAFGNHRIATDELVIPHPDLGNRRFVLAPWADLSPHFLVPGWNLSVQELLDRCRVPATVTRIQMEIGA